MATLNEYFENDFGHTLKAGGVLQNSIYENIKGNISFDFTSNSLFASYYFDRNDLALNYFKDFLQYINDNWNWNFNGKITLPRASLMNGIQIKVENINPLYVHAQFPGEEPIVISEIRSYGRIFLYSETQLATNEILILKEFGKSLKFYIQFRSSEFCKVRAQQDKPLAFISHDSRDKENFARPLFEELSRIDCMVWYDEFSLRVGDPLRETIELGLKKCNKCILLLTKNFLVNGGWTKEEFNGIFTRQLMEEKKIILPIWVDVSKQEVYDYSPILANIVAIPWNLGLAEIVLRLNKELKRLDEL